MRLRGAAQATADVTLKAIPDQRYVLSVWVRVYVPGLPAEQLRSLMETAHTVCPYSNAVRGNVEVVLLPSEEPLS